MSTPNASQTIDGPPTGPSVLTSVQHLETTRCRFECQTACQRRLHRAHDRERTAIFNALAYDPEDRFEKRAHRICSCCQFPVLYVTDDGRPSVHLARCRDRLCPLCSSARARESAERVRAITMSMDAPRFMTLTVPHSSDPLTAQLTRLMDAFRELRATDTWKRYVKGGVWSLELTYNAERAEWHPHIHAIFDGGFFPQPELKAEWSRIQGENVIVDVRALSSARAAGRYIAKYVSKVVDLSEWTEVQIREYAQAMHRRRTIHTFGSCHGLTAEAEPDDDAPPSSTRTVGVWVLRRRMRLGDEAAARAVMSLASVGGVFRVLLGDCCGDFEPFVGDELEHNLHQAITWIRSLDPETAATWKPPPPPQPDPKPPRGPDPALTTPPWDERDPYTA